HFTIDVNVPSHVADYYVTPAGGSKVTLGMSYGFRTSQASVSQLDTINTVDSVSSASTVCNVTVTAWTPTPTPIDGQCGSANGAGTTTAPTLGLCSGGAASTVTGSGPWDWTCDGINGGAPASCQAPVASGGSCPYAAAAAAAGLNDGCSNALTSGTIVANFFTGFANGFSYPVRPPWDVAGVDYCVGAPTSGQSYADPAGGGLPAGCIYAGDTVTCTHDGTTITGWDFTLHGGIQLVLNGSANTVTKNKFAAGTNCVDPVIRITATSGTFTMTYNSIDGGNADGCDGQGAFATEVAGSYGTASNTYVIQYNYFTRAWQDVLNFGGGALNVKYNYFYDNGLSSNHSDDFQSCGGTYPSIAIQFNTVFNSYADGYWTQPLHVESQCSSTVNNVVESQNTVVMISGNAIGCQGGANWPVNCSANGLLACKCDTGSNFFNGFSAYQNYLDWTDGALQAITDGCTGNPNATNLVWGTPSPNVNIRSGATFAK
ncbi:MAG: hypothetical protein AAB426_04535, partial [Myxococcota bacterium]